MSFLFYDPYDLKSMWRWVKKEILYFSFWRLNAFISFIHILSPNVCSFIGRWKEKEERRRQQNCLFRVSSFIVRPDEHFVQLRATFRPMHCSQHSQETRRRWASSHHASTDMQWSSWGYQDLYEGISESCYLPWFQVKCWYLCMIFLDIK